MKRTMRCFMLLLAVLLFAFPAPSRALDRYEAAGSEQELLALLSSALPEGDFMYIDVCADIELTGDATLRNGFVLRVQDGATLTVAKGATLTVEGTIFLWDSKAHVYGTLHNLGYIAVGADWSDSLAGLFFVHGAYDDGSGRGVLDLLSGKIKGVTTTTAQLYLSAADEASLDQALLTDTQRVDHVFIDLDCDLTLTKDTVIGAKMSLRVLRGATLTVPQGATLTIEGALSLWDGTLLSEGALCNLGEINIGVDAGQDGDLPGALLVRGAYDYGGVGRMNVIVGSVEGVLATSVIDGQLYLSAADEASLDQALLTDTQLVDHVFIDLDCDLTLTKDTVIGAKISLRVRHGATLTVPQGATLTIEGALSLWDGTLLSEGALCNLGEINIGVDAGQDGDLPGALLVRGAYDDGGVGQMNVIVGSVEGVLATSVIDGQLYVSVTDDETLGKALALEKQSYDMVFIDVATDVVLRQDATVREGVNLRVLDGSRLTVDAGATLTLLGAMRLTDGTAQVRGALCNLGSIILGDSGGARGSLLLFGAYDDGFGTGWIDATLGSVKGVEKANAVSLPGLDAMPYQGMQYITLTQPQYITAALAMGERCGGEYIIELCCDWTVTGSVVLPPLCRLHVRQGATLTVAQDGALTVQGLLRLWDGALCSQGELINSGLIEVGLSNGAEKERGALLVRGAYRADKAEKGIHLYLGEVEGTGLLIDFR